MKVRVKATGEIVDAVITQRVTHTGEQVYMTNDGRLIEESRLEFNIDDIPDYWTRLEHQYAGMAMQGILSNPELFKATAKNAEEFGLIVPQAVAIDANCFAHALVQKIKEERK